MTHRQALDLDLGAWQPTVVSDDVLVDPAPVAALQALLDGPLRRIGPGEPLPPLWHWAALARWSPSSTLANDGHPRRGSFLPPVALSRRVFAGGEVSLHQAVIIGDRVHRESEVTSVQRKTGRTGELVIVQVATRIHLADGSLAIEERQDIAYRSSTTQRIDDATPSSPDVSGAAPGAPLERAGEWTWSLRTDPTLLMRFSAATANAHRIHYDLAHATGVDGYPGLVVHGPLMSVVLAETIRLECPDAVVQRLVHRNRAPLFCGEPASLALTPQEKEGDGVPLELTLTSDGRLCSELAVTLLATPDVPTPVGIQLKGHHRA